MRTLNWRLQSDTMHRKDPSLDEGAVPPVTASDGAVPITPDDSAAIEDGDRLDAVRSGSWATGGGPAWTAGSRVTAVTPVTGTDGGGTCNGETIRVVGSSGEGHAAPLAKSAAPP